MKRCVVYITNENSSYIYMLMNSVTMLRHHNKTVPIRVFVIKDGSSQTIHRNGLPVESDWADAWVKLLKVSAADENLEIIEKPPIELPGEEGFFHMNRVYMGDLDCDSLLFLDADTFVFGDVEKIFDAYVDCKFAAAPAKWVKDRGFNVQWLSGYNPISSGVMLFNDGMHADWAKKMPHHSYQLRTGHPMGTWLRTQHEDMLLREEFATNIWASTITSSYLSLEHCQLIIVESDYDLLGQAIIFHCYTPNWRRAFNKLNGISQKKAPFMSSRKK